MSVISNNQLAGASGQGGGSGTSSYSIDRSLRFDSGSSSYLSRTPSSAGNRKTWTWSGWVKRSASARQSIFVASTQSPNNQSYIDFSADNISVANVDSGSLTSLLTSSAVYRDYSAWYHIVLAVDTTAATSTDRIKLYVNGTQVTQFSSATYPAQNYDTHVNNTIVHSKGLNSPFVVYPFDGYLADVHFIDGTQLAASDFGEFDNNNIWQPKQFTGSYGLVSVANATGALPIYNTSDAYGGTKASGLRSDSNASSLSLASALGISGSLDLIDQNASGRTSSTKTITNAGAVITSSSYRFYGGSARFTGASNSYASIASSSDFAFGTGDFTVEFWVKSEATNTNPSFFRRFFTTGPDSAASVQLGHIINTTGVVTYYANGLYITGSTNILNAWHHVALSRQSGTVRLFVDGILEGTATDTNNKTNNTPSIGCYNNSNDGRMQGELQDLRVYKGLAKYTSNFNPVVSSNNSFHLDFSDNSTAAALGTDTSGNGNDWTVNNISNTVAGKTYALSGHTATNGVAPNGGTPYWVDIVPSNANLNYWSASNLNYGFYEVHDSSLTESLYWTSTSYSTGNVTQARFDLRDFPTVSSVRIYARHVNGNTTTYPAYVARLLDSNKNVINNTSVSITSSTAQWLTIPVTGSPAFVEIYAPTPANARVYFHAIEVNGTVLTNLVATGANSDSLLDSPTNGTQTDTGAGGEVSGNYATLNPLAKDDSVTLSNGNLEISSTSFGNTTATFFLTSGKWYWEGQGSAYVAAICGKDGINFNASISGSGSNSIGWWTNGTVYYDGGNTSGGASFSSSDILGVALDMDAGVVYFYKNNNLEYTITFGSGTVPDLSDGVFPCYNGGGSGTRTGTYNFGQRPFAYTAPSGYKALCTANLPTPTIADGSTAMDVLTWTGTGTGTDRTISGLGFSNTPGLIWGKARSAGYHHTLWDIVRGYGATNVLSSDRTGGEGWAASGRIKTATSSSITWEADSGSLWYDNGSTTYVAWAWDAGSSTVTNTDGSVTSSVRANPSAGFSIVTYTGNSTDTATVGHGLNATPSMIFVKRRNVANDWGVYHTSGGQKLLQLNTKNPWWNNASNYWYSLPTSSVFYPDNTNGDHYQNVSGGTYVAYCFTSVEGYSAFGSYTGNGSTDGTFVFTGIRPKWLMIKEASAGSNSGHWMIVDTERDPFNIVNRRLHAELDDAEYTNVTPLDILSNGFKLRQSSAIGNFSGVTYIYAAFAENPFALNARAR